MLIAAPRAAARAARRASSLAHQSALDSSMTFASDRKTKIVCTIGPASLPRLPEMLIAGMNVARINCAHGDATQWREIATAVRAAQDVVRADGRALSTALCGSRHDVAALALDVKGPEIRVGRFGASVAAGAGGKQKEVPLRVGARLTLTTDPAAAAEGTASRLFISYPALAAQARAGQTIFVDDGNVELRVISADAARGELLVESLTDAPLGERKNVNLPGLVVDLPAVTKKDEVDIAIAREVGADFIFASFVQSADAVRQIRALAGPDIRIISKIESQAGLDRYDEILSASDGIMVARGDLGVQIPAERVVLSQKMMIARANVVGKVRWLYAAQCFIARRERGRPHASSSSACLCTFCALTHSRAALSRARVDNGAYQSPRTPSPAPLPRGPSRSRSYAPRKCSTAW